VYVVVVVDRMVLGQVPEAAGMKQIGHLGDIGHWVQDCPAAEWQAEAAIR
jgi:hypothetical protein